jgi:hypothetical protein
MSIGLGVSSVPDKLDVNGGIGMTTTTAFVPTNGVYLSAANTLDLTTSGAKAVEISTTGNVTLGSTGYQSCTGLTTNASGLIQCTASDANIKSDLGTITPQDGLKAVMVLPDAHRYEFKEGEGPAGVHQGFFAQDVQRVAPELVHLGAPLKDTPNGTLQFDKAELIADLTQALKAQQGEIEGLQAYDKNPCSQFNWLGRFIMGCR